MRFHTSIIKELNECINAAYDNTVHVTVDEECIVQKPGIKTLNRHR